MAMFEIFMAAPGVGALAALLYRLSMCGVTNRTRARL
jgi:hypothetical protein